MTSARGGMLCRGRQNDGSDTASRPRREPEPEREREPEPELEREPELEPERETLINLLGD